MSPQRRFVLLLAWSVEGGLGLLACLIGWWIDVPVWQTIHWNLTGLLWGIAVSMPMLLFFALSLQAPFRPLKRIKYFSEEIVRPLFQSCTLLDLALICLLAGFAEELFFRALVQELLASWWGLWPGLVAAGIIFGLVHMITPTYAVIAAIMGIYLGYCWIAADNLLVVAVAHAWYDFVALLYLVRWTNGRVQPITDESEIRNEETTDDLTD